VLAGSGLITTRNKCCEGGSTSRLGDYPQGLPESQLGTVDRFVGNQNYVIHMPLRDGVHERADSIDPPLDTPSKPGLLQQHLEQRLIENLGYAPLMENYCVGAG
jgi:hypothetical protein